MSQKQQEHSPLQMDLLQDACKMGSEITQSSMQAESCQQLQRKNLLA